MECFVRELRFPQHLTGYVFTVSRVAQVTRPR